MEFLKYLKNSWDTEEMRKIYAENGVSEYLPQRSNGIKFKNGLILSIQGSFGHYCSPRKTLPYDKYNEMEFALIGKNKTSKNVSEFKKVQEYINTDKFDDYFSGCVYGYVPVELIEELFQQLKYGYGLDEG